MDMKFLRQPSLSRPPARASPLEMRDQHKPDLFQPEHSAQQQIRRPNLSRAVILDQKRDYNQLGEQVAAVKRRFKESIPGPQFPSARAKAGGRASTAVTAM